MPAVTPNPFRENPIAQRLNAQFNAAAAVATPFMGRLPENWHPGPSSNGSLSVEPGTPQNSDAGSASFTICDLFHLR